MAETLKITNQPLPPHAQLIQMATAHWVSHIVNVAAKLPGPPFPAAAFAGIWLLHPTLRVPLNMP
jgi:hypothetical protein